MKNILLAACLLALLPAAGCAYQHFLGLHGPSVQRSLDIHQGITADSDCLDCHRPGNGSGAPATSHPSFSGCLRCHNDQR